MSQHLFAGGRYELSAELGRGSMGVVRHAHDTLMGRDVAIKTILLPNGLEPEAQQEFQKRFRREAQAAGKLSHPGIVTVFDYGEDSSNEPFIAMEYVPGFTLHELIQRNGALSVDWALTMACTLAEALQTAHEAGVVHRDLKPANILVRESDGAAKITDFGIARINMSELTQAGTTYGSPAYMAPERIQGGNADARSDLFSLAVILYEALTAERPFDGDDFTSTCYSIVNSAPISICTRDTGFCPGFEIFFARALAKNPDERYQNGESFSLALEDVRRQQSGFAYGAMTQRMSVTPTVAPVYEADPRLVTPMPHQTLTSKLDPMHRGIVIGGVGVILILLSFIAGWALSRDAPTPPAETPTRSSASTFGAQAAPESILPLQTEVTATPTSEETPAEAPSEKTVVAEPSPVEAREVPAEPSVPEPPKPTPQAAAPAPKPVPVVASPPEPAPVAQVELPPAPQEAPIEALAEPVKLPPPAPLPAPVNLDVVVKNSIRAGKLTILLDGDELHTIELTGEAGKLNRAYKSVIRQSHQELTAEIEIPPGAHTISVLAYSVAKDREFETSLDVDLEPGATGKLVIVAGRTFGKRLTMKLE